MRKVPKSREKIAPKKAPAKASAGRGKRRPMAEASDVQLLNFTDRSVPLVFQQNQRARRIIMRLDYGSSRIVVVLPKRTSRDEGKKFVLSNKEWIAERLDQLPETVPFEHGAVIPFMGLEHRILHRPTARGVVWCEDQEIHVAGQELHLSRRVSDWLKLEARREIETRAFAKAEQIGRKIKRITIRDTKSRWGSCTSEGELSFSWRLIFAPRHVMDYVISHEVAHLREMNHGPRFWKLCGELCRSVNASREWLEEYGTELYRYGR